MSASQENRQISVKSALPANKLLFSSMSTTEHLGRMPEFRIQLLSEDSDVKIADVLGKPMCVDLELSEGGTRHFHGIVTRFGSTGWSGEFATYEAVIHPWLWLLKKSSDCRIFQDVSVPDIVKEVCSTYGGLVSLAIDSLTLDYQKVPYCVQYRETDFDFVCRLLEDAGIYFYFTYTDDSHTMVLADSFNTHTMIEGYDGLKFTTGRRAGALVEESVTQWRAAGEIQSSSYVLNDYNFQKSADSTAGGMRATSQIKAAYEQEEYEMYDYPGQYVDPKKSGTTLAQVRMERLHGQCEEIDAHSDARGLFPGGLFKLEDHPRDDQNRKYLITGARYQIKGGEYASGGGGGDLDVECRFTAIGHTFAYRPKTIIAKPVVQGPQTAMVVGASGEEIDTDEFGRIKVQFHWDRLGKDDEKSSCWVRVSQSWAGKGWGAMTIPRIGMEVVVSFLEGDPDRPLVTGCVYNSDAMPPYALPENKTRTTFKTNSSKGGGGFNELRFEDKKGAEEIYMQAERDFNRVVKNNDTLKVGFEVAKAGDQTIDIKNDQIETIGNNQTLEVGVDCKRTIGNDQVVDIGNDDTRTTGNNQTVKIGNDAQLTIGNNDVIDIGGKQTVDIGSSQAVKAGTTIVFEASTSIEFKVGGSSIKIEPAKITIKSTQVEVDADASAKINAGAMMKISAGGIMTIEGAMVKIN